MSFKADCIGYINDWMRDSYEVYMLFFPDYVHGEWQDMVTLARRANDDKLLDWERAQVEQWAALAGLTDTQWVEQILIKEHTYVGMRTRIRQFERSCGEHIMGLDDNDPELGAEISQYTHTALSGFVIEFTVDRPAMRADFMTQLSELTEGFVADFEGEVKPQ